MKDQFLLLGGILAVLLVALQTFASLNAQREIHAAAEKISMSDNRASN